MRLPPWHDAAFCCHLPVRSLRFWDWTPIALRAGELGIPVTKPADINEAGVREAVRAHAADAWVVIAFGQKLSRELLDGVFAVNLHGSLLPAYRGAAPIQRAVMDGCAETGVSVISLSCTPCCSR